MRCLKRLVAVKEVCVSSLLLVKQTHSGQIKLLKKKIYFHTGAMNDARYANILTQLSAAKQLCVSVWGQMLALNEE